jgi:hypothetical protein
MSTEFQVRRNNHSIEGLTMNTPIPRCEEVQERLERLERQNRRLRIGGISSILILSGVLLAAQTAQDAAEQTGSGVSRFEEFLRPAEWTELQRKFLMSEVRMVRDMLPAQAGMECGRVQGLSEDGQRVVVRVHVIEGDLPEEPEPRKEVLTRKANVTARSVILEFMPMLQAKDIEIEFVDFDAGGMKSVATFKDGVLRFP